MVCYVGVSDCAGAGYVFPECSGSELGLACYWVVLSVVWVWCRHLLCTVLGRLFYWLVILVLAGLLEV